MMMMMWWSQSFLVRVIQKSNKVVEIERVTFEVIQISFFRSSFSISYDNDDENGDGDGHENDVDYYCDDIVLRTLEQTKFVVHTSV